jgi:putative tricarboxylic transport membrane protein
VNLPGAGGGIAYAFAVGERADDPRVIVAASPATTLRLAQRQFGPLRADQVRWIGGLGAEFGVIAVAADAPWRTLGDMLDAWSADPPSLVASGGSAVVGQDHVKLLLLARAAGIEPRAVRYVPFDGGGEALTALLGGFVQIFSGDASEIEAQLEAGNVRVLAVLAPDRLGGLLADVPTAREAGYAVEWVTWRGFFAPGEISDDAYRAWVERLRTVGESDEWAEALARTGLRPWLRTGAEFEDFVHAQVRDFEGLARELGLIR